jgi:VWFA-related protein
MRTLRSIAGITGLALVISLLLAGGMRAQAPAATTAPAAPPTEPVAASTPFAQQVEVTEVLLDAQVTDKEGNVIVGLGPGDFRVEENGKPVQVTDVKFYSSRPQIGATGAAAVPAESTRYYILLFHDQRAMNTEIRGVLARELDAGRRAREWVSHLAAGDLVAVTSYGTSLVVEQDFTTDPTLLQHAIDRAVRGSDPTGNWPSRLPAEGGPSLLRNLPKGNGVRDATTTIYGAFETLARATKPLVGRKNLVLFSTGFGNLNSFGQYVPDQVFDVPATRALNDANIAVYAVDLFKPSSNSPLQGSLSNFASETGGRYFQHLINFGTALQQIAEETSGYYLLAYRATHPSREHGYQRVKVTTVNPGFRVKARQGYLY